MSTAALRVRFERRPVVVVMGVSGSGKSTIGAALAQQLGVPFLDGDNFHPEANVTKMSQGISLTDDDRWPWLEALGKAMRKKAEQSGGVIAACSALKCIYRDKLSGHIELPMVYALLDGERDTLFKRMNARRDHYMPASLLESQLADLERPRPDEPVLTVSIEQDVDSIVDELMTVLGTLSN